MTLTVNQLSLTLGEKQIIKNVSLSVQQQQFVGLLGPNGCGKSSILKCIYKQYPIKNDTVHFLESDLNTIDEKCLATQLAVVSQWQAINFDFTVYDIVQMGRYPHKKQRQKFTKEDDLIILVALEKVGLLQAANESYSHLSGGEKQRVILARALAQQPKFLILDEPTNHLDIKYQQEILRLVKALNIPVLGVLHDLSLASQFCDKLYFMRDGAIHYHGSIEEMMKPDIIQAIYDVNCEIITSQTTGNKTLSYI
ncbi:ABC transporter ATP-binding protein [Vagococcus silagei]|uniref:ABC transporter ATP-binding protein n=1 Tax=Vagococcus silagei TaxID=2508885 RepID=UPI00194DDC37|nr:ABC transporter ATP-binding protein [Vagococcus silagei]